MATVSLGGVGAMEDLKARMSKKIAQLTKVIYHLNTRNEDQVFDLQDMSGHYETEIQQILLDTAERVNCFRKQIEEKVSDDNAAEAVAALKASAEKKHMELQAEYELYKRNTELSVASNRQEAQLRIDALVTEVETVKRGFKEQIIEMEAEHKRSLHGQCNASAEDVKTARQQVAHLHRQLEQSREEAAEAKKHKQALVDGHEKRIASLRAEMEEGKEELEAVLQRAREEGEQGKILQGRNDSLEQQVRILQTDLAASKAQQDLALERERTVARQRREEEASEWQAKLDDALTQTERERVSKASIAADIETLRRSAQSNEAHIQTLTTVKASLEEVLAKERQARALAETEAKEGKIVQRLQAEVENLSTQLKEEVELRSKAEATSSSVSVSLAATKKKLEEATAKALSARQEAEEASKATIERLEESVRAEKENVARINGEVKKRDAQIGSLMTELQVARKEVEVCKVSINKLESEIKSLTTAGSDVEKRAMARVKALEGDLAKARKEVGKSAADASEKMKAMLKKKMEAMRAEHKRAMAESASTFRDQLMEEKDAAAAKLATREDVLRQQMAEQKRNYDVEVAELRTKHESEVVSLVEERQNLQIDFKQQIANLLQKVADSKRARDVLVEETKKQIADIEAEGREAQTKTGRLESQLADANNRERILKDTLRERNEDVVREQREREEALALAASTKEELEQEGRRRVEDGAKAMERLTRELEVNNREWAKRAEDRLDAALALKAEDFEREKEALVEEMERVKEEEKARLQRNLEELAREREAQLQETIDGKFREVAELKEQHKQTLATVEGAHATALATMAAENEARREEAEGEQRRALAAMADAHQAERRGQTLEHEAAIASLRASHVEAERALTEEGEERTRQARAEGLQQLETCRAELSARHEEAVRAADAEHRNAVATTQDTYEAKINLLDNRIGVLEASERNLVSANNDKEGKLSSLDRTLKDTEEQLRALRIELDNTVYAMRNERANAEAELSSSHEAELARLHEDHCAATARHREHVEDLSNDWKAKEERHMGEYNLLLSRFEARESRPEDLERISAMEEEVSRVSQAMEEQENRMRIMKGEMMNREEVYNKRFGSKDQNVPDAAQGTMMDWMLKKKEKKEKNKPRRSSMIL